MHKEDKFSLYVLLTAFYVAVARAGIPSLSAVSGLAVCHQANICLIY